RGGCIRDVERSQRHPLHGTPVLVIVGDKHYLLGRERYPEHLAHARHQIDGRRPIDVPYFETHILVLDRIVDDRRQSVSLCDLLEYLPAVPAKLEGMHPVAGLQSYDRRRGGWA